MQQQIDSLRGYPSQPYHQPQAPAYAPGIPPPPAPAPMYYTPQPTQPQPQPQPPPQQQFAVSPPSQSTPNSTRQPRSFKRLKQYQPNESENDDSMMSISVNMNSQIIPSLPEPSMPPMDEERVHALARKKNPVGSIPVRYLCLLLTCLSFRSSRPCVHIFFVLWDLIRTRRFHLHTTRTSQRQTVLFDSSGKRHPRALRTMDG